MAAETTPGDGSKGWYVDPESGEVLRFWNGSEWTDQTRQPDRPIEDYQAAEEQLAAARSAPAVRQQTAAEFNEANRENNMDAAETAGYCLAVFLPIIGLILGFVLVGRSSKHGIWIVLLSLFCGFIFWPVIFFAAIAA